MARIEESRRTYIEELATNPRVNLMVLSERIDIVFHEDESEVSLAEKIAEKLYDTPQLITKLLQQEAIEFLLQCWDMEGESLIAEMYAREIEQLHFLGFLSYEDDTILLNIEAKDNFFFSLKSRRVQEELEEGTRLENILFGMLFLYGILDIYECCQMIQEEMFPELTYDELEEFILLRIVFWQSGILLRNQMNSRLLLASREVENRNEVFIQWSLREDLSWKRYSEDEYKNLALGNGIGGWDGIPELYDFVMKNIENDQYKVMMIVKSLVVKIQNGLTYEEVMNGHSKLRNKGIANVFSQMGLVEAWGSGIKRIISTAEQYGLPKPRFQEFDNMFRVELFRNNSMTMAEKKDGEDSEKVRKRFGESSEKTQMNELTDTQKKIVELLCYDKQLSAKKIAEKLGLGSRSIEKNIKKLKTLGFLIRHGSPKNGYWEVTDCITEEKNK